MTNRVALDAAGVAACIDAATFAPRDARPPRIGIEAELIPVDATTRSIVPLASRLLPVVQRHAIEAGWERIASAKGAPRYAVPGGGSLTFEPGGQIEYATPPFASPSALLAHVRRVLMPLIGVARDAEIEMVGAGVDPCTPADQAPLQIHADRYRTMDAYFAQLGDAGARMMRQTASIQVNVDPGPDPVLAWRMLNALAPYLTAVFANSREYAGQDTGWASYRAHTWQALDPSRTGLPWGAGDPATAYTSFALDATAMFQRSECGDYMTFGEWVQRGEVTAESTAAHLSTLFPEVRPRGWFEIRSIDGQRPEWYAAPVLMIAGLVLDPESMRLAADRLGDPDAALLVRAGRSALRDPALAATAADLVGISLEGCRRLGTGCSADDVATALAFFDRFTLQARCPADDAGPASIATAA